MENVCFWRVKVFWCVVFQNLIVKINYFVVFVLNREYDLIMEMIVSVVLFVIDQYFGIQ